MPGRDGGLNVLRHWPLCVPTAPPRRLAAVSVAHAVLGLACCLSVGAQDGGGAPGVGTPVSAICVVAETGLVAGEEQADLLRPPASMIKMMLMLLVSEGVDAGRWRLDATILISEHAQSMGGTQIFLGAGAEWALGSLMEAMCVASANDAAMAIAEGLWGSETAYLETANRRAAELGMINTVVRSVHGLPPDKGEELDQTTARDMALLASACVRHARILDWVGRKEVRVGEEGTVMHNTNKMLWRMEGCDGIKTGFIRAAGFCVAATVERGGIRLVGVVMGDSKYGRFNRAKKLLEEAFARLRRVRVLAEGEGVGEPVRVRNCEVAEVGLMVPKDVWLTMDPGARDRLVVETDAPDLLVPPIPEATPVAAVRILLDGVLLAESRLVVSRGLVYHGWRLMVRDGIARWEGL